MDWVQALGWQGLQAIVQLFLHPFYYVGILFIILQYRRQIAMERRLFSTKLHALLPETWRIVLWGWVGGLCVSVLMAGIGATVQQEAVLLLWIVSLLLVIVRVRYLCWAYAVGVIGMLQVVLSAIPGVRQSDDWAWLTKPLFALDISAMLALVAILHLAEAIYVRKQGTRLGMPMFVEGKRGRIVGGYQLQGFWPMALFLVVPLQQAAGGPLLPWTPLLGGELWQNGWTIVGFPVMIGFTEMTISRLPKDKARIGSNLLILYALILLGLAALSAWLPVLTFTASLFAILLHEAMIVYSRWDEGRRRPIYVHTDKGLKILAVLPGSPAEELGLKAGEIVSKVNGVPVRSKQALHQAMQLNPAFCRLEVLDGALENRFLKRALYSGEHHQLGIILAPDQDVLYYVEEKQVSIWAYLSRRLIGLLRNEKNSKSM
ncbi:PDZ domain-containing protein [Paenibacillus validus]|uniref:Serine protease n=1 Tax=Paenibacillus validus TaxID=44253 RepID=A0A7X3CUV4_9BACL|nr:PDZ domain-containing protein [Paenibacillus validus]MUG72522.1 serine protease [Paenibacillus validus]